jgi:hypothetical protein
MRRPYHDFKISGNSREARVLFVRVTFYSVLNFVDEPKVNCNHRCDTPSPVTSHILLSIDGEFIANSFEIPRTENISICVYGIFSWKERWKVTRRY